MYKSKACLIIFKVEEERVLTPKYGIMASICVSLTEIL